MKLQFLGATQTVTGSRTLVEAAGKKILIDCGLFQGFKHLRLRNWDPFPFDVQSLDAVILSHAHLDHSGAIPLLVKRGYRGPVYSTKATRDLAKVLLPDSGFLQEEEARYANKKGFSKHSPALALYTQKEAEESLKSFRTADWLQPIPLASSLGHDLVAEFHPAGHLLGAASIWLSDGQKSFAFSGDIGRKSDPMIREPKFTRRADAVILESTYGNRQHLSDNPEEELLKVIQRTAERQGVLLIPSFAVGRAQLLLYYIHRLKNAGRIPNIPVYLNSPMASHANEILIKEAEESKLSKAEVEAVCQTAHVVSSPEESIALNLKKGPMIIIAASGMATGGRVLHHLKAFAGDPRNTILFAGFQAGGTRGEALINGVKEIKIHGEYWAVRAEVDNLQSMSAHADQEGLLGWLGELPQKPRRVFINHGEPEAAESLRRLVQDKMRIEAITPEYLRTYSI